MGTNIKPEEIENTICLTRLLILNGETFENFSIEPIEELENMDDNEDNY